MKNKPFYAISIKEVFERTRSSARGISSDSAQERISRYGSNAITPKPNFWLFSLLWRQFSSPLVYILVIASIIAYFLGDILDALVIGGVIIINAFIGVFQERKAEVSLNQLKKYIVQNTSVFRDGKLIVVDAKDIVVGDVVKLTEGATVPADIRLFKIKNLKIDESVLTGESLPVRKTTGLIDTNTPIVKRINIAFAGTNVISGIGWGVVVATADNTEFGRLAVATTRTTPEVSPLDKKIQDLGSVLLIAIAITGVAIFLIGSIQGQNIGEILFLAIATAVAAVPEGLPAVVTIALAVGVSRMAKKNAITRKLSAIETLGVVNLIASDKTGTLTENMLSVKKFYFPEGKEVNFEGSGYNSEGKVTLEGKPLGKDVAPLVEEIFSIATLASDAELKRNDSSWEVIGDPTEGAILVASKKLGIEITDLRQYNPRIDEIPFSSELRLMASANYSEGNMAKINIKGSIKNILKICSKYQDYTGKIKPLSNKIIEQELERGQKIAKNGYRLIAVAINKNVASKSLKYENLEGAVFLGFMAMIDAPRTSAIEQVQQVQKYGIKVVMITGDLKETANAVAKMMGIIQKNEAISETELLSMNEHEFSLAVRDHTVFAEISPQIKLKIVEELEAQGNTVAVTGDGANDAPILKRAPVGIAVGIGGTDIARSSADIVLADNNFATIVTAIKEGRLIFENIRRSIWYLVSTNATEILIIICALIVGAPAPLAPTQILWINVITDGTGTIGLALEKSHDNLLKNAPRSNQEPLINKIMLKQMMLVATVMTLVSLFYYFINLDAGIERARTMTFATLTTLQVFNLFNARSFSKSAFGVPLLSNKFLILSALGSMGLVVASTEFTFFQAIFATSALSILDWVTIVSSSFSVIIVMEVYKSFSKKQISE